MERLEAHPSKALSHSWTSSVAAGALAAAAIVLAAWPASVFAVDAPKGNAPFAFGDSAPFGDSIEEGRSPLSAPEGSAGAAQAYLLADGSRVRVEVAPEYADGPVLTQLLSRLGTLHHGSEMSRLTVYVANAASLQQACGSANACYFPFDETMLVPGEESTNGMPFEMLVAHEYGHHIALNRSTSGWNAVALGTRRWATQERVCDKVTAGSAFPGDQGAHYWDNPGEVFAQTYAFEYYPDAVPWWWNFSAPGQADYDAVDGDVTNPSGEPRRKWARRLAAGSGRASRTVSTQMDGPLLARIRQPRSGRFNLVVVSAEGRVLQRARRKHNRAKGGKVVYQLRYDVCGEPAVKLEVRRRSGNGRFVVKVTRP